MTDRERRRLEKMLFYVLARRPDEFGLLLWPEGWVKLKDLHRALVEVEGFRDLRLKRLRDFFLVFKPDSFEFREEEGLVRARPDLAAPGVREKALAEDPPRLLFTPVRPRAWIRVHEEGLASERIVLTPDQELAGRLARRRGALVIEVDTWRAMEAGAVFERYLECLYLSSWIPAGALSGPEVDEEFRRRYAPRPKPKEEPEEPAILVPEPPVAFRKLTRGRKKDPAWKQARRRRR